MKLLRFRVQNYRSFHDSGWVEVSNYTTVIGASQAGKTNLLTALWKLNPASRAGKPDPKVDLPKAIYDKYSEAEKKPVFVEAVFELDDEAKKCLREVIPNCTAENVFVCRDLNGEVGIAFDGTYRTEEVQQLTPLLIGKLPKMIYSPNYGNLDSNIYVPTILNRFNRFGYNAASKSMTRSLRIILSYYGISSTRLLREVRKVRGDVTIKKISAADLKAVFDKYADYYAPIIKEGNERLTNEFAMYWRQTKVSFKLVAEEDALHLYVDDGVDVVDLQGQSVSLQWLLSFFMIYTVEMKNLYANTILLFDESGMALNPEAQKYLVSFFEKMQESNQVMVSTPNAFMIAASNFDKVRVVYRDVNGFSCVSNSLDLNSDNTNALSLQAVFQAFGMASSTMKFTSCSPVIVLDESDGYYLDMIKGYLSAGGFLYNPREIIVVPSGVDGAEKTARLLTTQFGDKPYVILPSTQEGNEVAEKLLEGFYATQRYRVRSMKRIVGKNKTLESLIPLKWIKAAAGDYIASITDASFKLKRRGTVVEQIENYALQENKLLPPDYRVQIAKRVRQYELRKYPKISVSRFRFNKWKKLFSFFKTL
ncbi:MAG: hypothetical protein IJF71_00570 [Clostridia bacterium]|nr:hypothetical protein [Clostridia bacterium]